MCIGFRASEGRSLPGGFLASFPSSTNVQKENSKKLERLEQGKSTGNTRREKKEEIVPFTAFGIL